MQCGNAAPSGLSARTAVAQHSAPASDAAHSEGTEHSTVSFDAHVVTQLALPVTTSLQQTCPPVHGVPGHPVEEPELEPPLLLPLELPLPAPLELAFPPLLEPPLLLPPELPLPAAPLLPPFALPLLLPLGVGVPPSPATPLGEPELPHATHTSVHATTAAQPNEKDAVARDVMEILMKGESLPRLARLAASAIP